MRLNQIIVVATSCTKHVVLLAVLLLAGFLLSACKQESKTAAGGDITGVYTLVSVNDNKVPASVSHDGANLQVRSGSFTINADGTCGTKTTFVPPNGAEATRDVSATYAKEGSNLTMKWQGAGMTTATIESGTLTMNNEGMLLVYKK